MSLRFVLLIFLVILVFGCATAPMIPPPPVGREVGIYHRVVPGETLWRISQTYAVDLDDIVRANRIPDAAIIEKGQLIFIPGARGKKQEVATGSAAVSNFFWPVKGKIISYFGNVNNNRINKGIDIQSVSDSVFAAAFGKVTFCDYLKGYGQTIIIEHANGIATVYAGDWKASVKLGDYANASSLIARKVSGSGKGGILLHFEVRRGYRSQNPLYYLP